MRLRLAALLCSLAPVLLAQPLTLGTMHQLDRTVGADLRQVARHVVLLVPTATLSFDSHGRIQAPAADRSRLCPGHPHAGEARFAQNCSGVVLRPGVLLSAAHCIASLEEKGWTAVLGHDGDPSTPYQHTPVTGILQHMQDEAGADVVVLRVASDFGPREELAIRAPKAREDAHLLGHPQGLPLTASTCALRRKACAQAAIVTQLGRDWFLASLEGYPGSSGAPVFGSDGRTLIGLWSASPLVPSIDRVRGCWRLPPIDPGDWGGRVSRLDTLRRQLDADPPAEPASTSP
jgi:hypothetical protein